MIRIQEGDRCFNYRVVGIAARDEHVLLHRASGDDFWAFPGGRAELGEPAARTLRREMLEELSTDIEVGRLLWVVENFFTYAGKRFHEIALYFAMRLPPTFAQPVDASPFPGAEPDVDLTFQWCRRRPEVLAALPLLPSFLCTAVRELPASVQHVVHHDER